MSAGCWRAGLLALLLAGPVWAKAQEPSPISTRSGVYTEKQADRGESLFQLVCGECHQADEFDRGFVEAWAGRTADVLFDEIRATMPEDSPGSLRSSEYAAVLAFLFRLNGLKSGEDKLPNSSSRLKAILIETAAPEGDTQ